MKKLLLHIGAPKSGSSTIQSALGHHLTGKRGLKNNLGETIKYACLLKNDEVLIGPSLLKAHSRSISNYIASDRLPDNVEDILKRLDKLEKSVEKDDVVILSNEGWANGLSQSFKDALNRFSIPVEILFIVRAPVDWMNSSWWQWGAWSGLSLEDWIKSQMPSVDYYSQYEHWNGLDIVESINIYEISQGLIGSLENFLNLSADSLRIQNNVNVGTNFSLLRHLINNKEKYGRKVHDPQVEFKLNKLLNLPNYPPPFVIPHAMAKFIIKNTISSSKYILNKAQTEDRKIPTHVIAKYLDPDAYTTKDTTDLSRALTAPEDDVFIGTLVDWILDSSEPNLVPISIRNFNPARYLSLHSDVAKSGMNPYEHYVRFGIAEGRKI